jgi:hypothetical protein
MEKTEWKDIAVVPWELIDMPRCDFARGMEQIAFFPQTILHFH